MPQDYIGHVIFCDDMRLEMGNKPSFMGCYIGGEMSCPFPFPALLPKFFVAAWIIVDVDDVPEFVKLFIKFPDGQMTDPIETTPTGLTQVEEGITKLLINIMVPISPFPIQCEGLLEVFIETQKGRIRIGRLKIVQTPGAQEQNPEMPAAIG